MGKAVALMTAGLGTYMTLKMWSEFNEALGTVFGASWGVIIATIAYLVYSVEKNDKLSRESTMQDRKEGLMSNLANDDQPLGFIVGVYIFIIFVFEVILGPDILRNGYQKTVLTRAVSGMALGSHPSLR